MLSILLIEAGLASTQCIFSLCYGGLGIDEIILPATDLIHRLADVIGFHIDALCEAIETGFHVTRIHNTESTAITEAMRFAHQDALPEAVESRYAQTFGGLTVEQAVNALAHFTRRLVGEGYGTNMLGSMTLMNQPGDLARDNTGFAATGTGQHEAGVIYAGHGLLLRWVEIFQVQGC